MHTRSKAATAAPPPQSIARRALRMTEAAHALGISRSAIYDLTRAGLLGYIRLAGGSRRIPLAEIDRFIAARTVRSGAR